MTTFLKIFIQGPTYNSSTNTWNKHHVWINRVVILTDIGCIADQTKTIRSCLCTKSLYSKGICGILVTMLTEGGCTQISIGEGGWGGVSSLGACVCGASSVYEVE